MIKEKLDIDMELEELIEKYDLDRHYPAYRPSRRACDYMHKWIKELSNSDKVFLFIGMDEHALKIIEDWGETEKTKNINTLLIGAVEELRDLAEELEGRVIYIVSYTRTTEILHWIWEHGYQAESIYDKLENVHIY